MTIETKKAANINEAIQIINSLLPNGTFEFVTENYSDDYTVTKRHFSGTNEHGATCYKMIEFVTDGKLQTVRFINTYRDTAIDIIIENFIAGTQDAATDAETETATDTANNNTATDANEEIINCTDDIIITGDAYAQMIHTELANAQIATGNYAIEINGEWVFFSNHKITHIDAEDKLKFSFEYTPQGRKQFRHNGRVISRDGVIKFFENKETAKAQEKSFREFFINPDAPKHGFFQVMVSPTFADSREHNYSRYFEYYNDAINFVNDAIKFCGDVPTHITIRRDKQAGKVCYHRMPDGSIRVDKPDTDFFKNYSTDEIKSRIGEIDRAIANNKFAADLCELIPVKLALHNAIDLLAVTRNFYEFVLHENAPVTLAETDGSEDDDFADDLPALIPADDSDDDDELIDEPNERYNGYIDDEPPTNDKDITPDEMLAIVDTLDAVNAAAPYGWQLDYDGKGFPVEFNGKVITTLDSLALTKVLPPEQFFDQFNPDVPPKERYLNDLHKELDTLLDFRKFVEDDPDRLSTLSNLIEGVKREILDAELDTEHPPDIEFDEHGEIIPWF